MRRFISYIILFLTVVFFKLELSAQSPWIKNPKSAYVQSGLSGVIYNMVSIGNEILPTNNFSYDLTAQLYAEYGLFKNADCQLVVPYKFVGFTNTSGSNVAHLNGIGNLQFGLKYLILNKNAKISAGLSGNFNTGKQIPAAGLRTGYIANTIMPYLTFGSSRHKWYYYGTLGYGAMDNQYADFLKVFAEVGKKIRPNWHLILIAELRKSLTEGKFAPADNASFQNTGLYLDNQQFMTFGIKANYEFVPSMFGATLSFFGAAYVRNVAAGPAMNLSFYRKFN